MNRRRTAPMTLEGLIASTRQLTEQLESIADSHEEQGGKLPRDLERALESHQAAVARLLA